MRYPEFLKPGGRIGLIAPSFGCATEPYISCLASAKDYFRAQGFSTVSGPNCTAADGIGKSSSAEKCGAEINDFFLSDRSDVILSCGGGETMCEDLAFVDFAAISSATPKWFMGFSDNTNLTFTLPTLCDTAAVYGPCAPAFGMRPLHPSLLDARALLCGEKREFTNYPMWELQGDKSEEKPLAPYCATEPFELKLQPSGIKSACFSGRLIGGCLDVLQVLCGTKFDRVADFAQKYKNDGIIWFLEACDLTPFGIRRAVWQLEQAGWFEHVRGFLIGRSMHYGEDLMGLNCYSAYTDILQRFEVPVLLDADIGHLPPMMPLVSGALAEIEAFSGFLRIKYFFE